MYRPWEFYVIEAPIFQDSRHMKVVRSVLRTCRLYPQELILLLIFVRGWVDPRTVAWQEKLKIPVPQSEIKPATFRLLAQYINRLRHRVPQAKILQSFKLLATYWRVMGSVRYRKYHSSSSFIRVWGQTNFPLNGYSSVSFLLLYMLEIKRSS